jgi:hypothetical protein
MLVASATFGGGNLQLQTLSLDGSTWINVGSSVTAAGLTTYDLPPGQDCIAVTTAHGGSRSLTLDSRLRVPCARFARALTGNVAPVNPSRAH